MVNNIGEKMREKSKSFYEDSTGIDKLGMSGCGNLRKRNKYRKEQETKGNRGVKMGETRETAYIPKNIRQIGVPDIAKKIYVEDYVITYINGIFNGSDEQEKVLLLFGGEALSGPCHYIYIRGAFEVEVQGDANKFFEAGDFQNAMKESKRYFQDLPLIGWALIRQGQPVTFEEKMRTTWEAYMSRIPLFFLGDILEKEEIFYWKYDGSVKVQPGYYIFYEKNKAMQEYMIEKRKKNVRKEEPAETNRVVEGFRSRLEETQNNYDKLKNNRWSIGVSIFLVIVVLAIGMTLLNHYEKMDEIQASVNALLRTLSERELQEEAVLPPENTTDIAETEAVLEQYPADTESVAQVEPPTATVVPRVYTVKRGETLLSITLALYGDVNKMEEICRLNQISNPDAIYEGQELQIP